MRLAIAIFLTAALAIPTVAIATGAPGLGKPTEFSSATKKKRKAAEKQKTDENVKAGPPDKGGKSDY